MKTSDLTGAALDWAVAKAEGSLHPVGNVQVIDGKWLLICVGNDPEHCGSRVYFAPSTDWSQGGPLIERELHAIDHMQSKDRVCAIIKRGDMKNGGWNYGYGPTPLIAAMRCLVASRLGDEVEIPEELK